MRNNALTINIREGKHEGYKSYSVESDEVRLVLIPELGAKIVSILYKPTGKEWLLDHGQRSLRKPDVGLSFVNGDMSGWDECFPTIDSCVIGQEQSIVIPDHGEVWSVPWSCEVDTHTLTCTVEGVCLPYTLSRKVSLLSANQVRLHYHIENKGTSSLPFLWVPHPQFQVTERTSIILPESVKEMLCVYGGQKLTVGNMYNWGEQALVLPELTGDGRKFYTQGISSEGWCGLQGEKTGDFLLMAVRPELVPYLGVWIDEGMFNDRTVIALEPSIGHYDSLSRAVNNGTAHILKRNETFDWNLDLLIGSGKGRDALARLII